MIMDCKTANEYINLYADNMLGEEQTQQLFSHIESCAECKKDLENTLLLKKKLHGLGELDAPEGLALSAIKKAKKNKISVFAFASVGVAAVAALVIIFITGIIPGTGINETVQEMALTERNNSIADEGAGALPKEMAAPQDEAAAVFEEAAEEPEADSAMAPDAIVEDECTQADDLAAEEQEPAMDLQAAACELTFSGSEAQIFKEIFDAFMQDYDIQADVMRSDTQSTVSFILHEEAFKAFQALVYKDNLLYIGELYPGCNVIITYLE